MYCEHVVKNFSSFFLHREGPKYVNMLTKWCPENIYPLLKDSLSDILSLLDPFVLEQMSKVDRSAEIAIEESREVNVRLLFLVLI
jgi:hypothetical protein